MDKIPIRHINAIYKEPDFSKSFSIRNIDGLLAGRDMVQELHRHDFFYVLALKKGSGDHEIDFTPYTIGDNSVFFMRPGQVHRLVLKAGSTGYLMQFRDDIFLPKASTFNHYQLDDSGFQMVHMLLTYIFREEAEKKEKYQEVIKANMDIFLIELARQQNSRSSDHADLYIQERLEKLLELLETEIYSYKQVSQFAALLNLSPYQLNAITKTTLGKTCSELINEYIILEAKRQILATSSQINQIADRLGYEDVSYFIRFFKKHSGYSPEAFRHKFR